MPKASPLRSSFNAGELSPLIMGRVDVSKYASGCETLQNAIPVVQGPAERRPGWRFVAEVKDSTKYTWLARFVFNETQAFTLEFGHLYVRFFTNQGQLLTGAVTAYSPATSYVIADLASSAGVNYYCKAPTTGVAPPNATFWHPLTGNIYEVPSPYTTADLRDATSGLFRLSMVGSNDVIRISVAGHPLKKLQRFSNTKWVFSDAALTWGPFKKQNLDKLQTVYSSATTGAVTLTSNASIFSAGHVGAFFYLQPADLSTIKPWTPGQQFKTATPPLNVFRRSEGRTYQCTTTGAPATGKVWRTGPDKPIHTHGTVSDGGGMGIDATNVDLEGLEWKFIDVGYGYVLITGFTNSTTVSATVQSDYPLPAGCVGLANATFRWAHGSFSAAEGYPEKLAFFRERLTLTKGSDFHFSGAGDFDNFASRDDSGNVTPDKAIQATMPVTGPVQWLSSGNALLIGTDGAELACSELTSVDAFAPGNVKIEVQSGEGSRAVAPLRVGDTTLFVQKSGRKLQEIAFNFEKSKFVPHDLTVLAEHVTKGGIIQTAWHNEPYVAAWSVLPDGHLIGFTFNRDQDVLGWHHHPPGGAGVCESICVIPAPDGKADQLWMLVRMIINGVSKRYVGFLERGYVAGDAQNSAFYVDCGLTYNGAPATIISGLAHLEGAIVQVLADGAQHPDRTVSGAQIILQSPASVVHVGLGYRTTIIPTRIEAGAADGTAQGKTKRINKVVIRLLNTLGAKAGPSLSALQEIPFRTGSMPMDTAPPLFTGDKDVDFGGDYDFDGRIVVVQDAPLPMTLVAIFPQLHTYDR